MVLESTKLERLRVIRDATFVDRFERADAEITLTPAVSEGVTGGASPSFSIALTPAVSDGTTEQRTGRIIDDFEDADLAEYNGDTSDAQIQGNVVDDGTYALAIPTGPTGSTTDYFIYSLDDDVGEDLPIYPQQGDRFEASVYHENDIDPDTVIAFGVQDLNNFYFVRLGQGEDEAELVILQNGVETQLVSDGVSIPSGEWLTVDISWFNNGDMEVDLKDAVGSIIANLDTNDDTYASGGVGFGEAQDFEN